MGWRVLGRCALVSGSSLCVLRPLACGLVTILLRLYIGSGFLWYSFFFLVWRVSICDHLGYNSGTVLVYSYALTGPTALYAPEEKNPPPQTIPAPTDEN